ncbi:MULTISPECIES: polymer-forming cytoskeletal protein [unclassified Thermoanaerobacterium]|uniref:bactofilin family protein n=1 Tax=unclassified Thermoanaerobacterium TaxID=2622527 RepID=UPI000A1473DF|nr:MULTISPECIES: polymer-forming cytoskeletal protein [unclassified Thermoanaerobacterium]MDE4541457.1 polymer-forming cytoskeletal protein [Thermoanaerobacterium sp. R66]ORX23017.1 cell shape determination protein CcmA [Thermoanaerobacterium sp. PSU-2]HHV73172.1 polymer-forming cytoskeletal protein [Thermoanaerobacterium sp.]
MFQRKDANTFDVNTDKIDTIIGKNTKIEGNISSQGTMRIDGLVTGKVEVEGNLIVGENSKIEADIKADNISVSGEIVGNLTIKNQVQITSTGKVYGDIEVQNLIIDEGAIFDGKCKMNKKAEKNAETQQKKKDVK